VTWPKIEFNGMDKIIIADGKMQEARIYHNPQEVPE
jgi:hypothetical protein